MSSEWTDCKLSEVATFRQGLQVPVDKQSPDHDEKSVKFIRISDLTSSAGSRFIERCEGVERYMVESNDVIMVRYGDTGFVGRGFSGVIANNLFSINPKQYIDKSYLYYFLKQPFVYQFFKALTTSAGLPAITHKIAGDLDFRYPPIQTQKSISKFLELLDDRITHLRETNTTLEAIAQALFKSWFVDFDPVHAKMQGLSPYGMDEATATLFPGGFEESGLGFLPQGWRVGTLADIASFHNGYAFKSKDWSEAGHPVIKIGNVKPSLISFDGCSYVGAESVIGLDRFKLKRGDLLVGMTGYVGVTGLVTDVSPAAYLNQRVGRIATSAGVKNIGFVFCLTRHEDFKAFAEGQSHGSAQANVSGSDLLKFKSVIPSDKVIDVFNQTVESLIESILSNHEQAQSLSTLRDTLLPRLISGQISLAEVATETI